MEQAMTRQNLGKFREVMDVPNLLAVQRDSYESFLQKDMLPDMRRKDAGLEGVFRSVFPIYDSSSLSYMEFVSYTLGTPKLTPEGCRERGETYSAPLKATLRLVVREKDKEKQADDEDPFVREIKEQEVYLCDLPLMTDNGTFIINGAERVVVSQLHRSPGLVFEKDEDRTLQSGKKMYVGRLIPYRGVWLEFEFDLNGIMYARIDRRKKVLATTFLRALEYSNDEAILKLFFEVEDFPVRNLPVWSKEDKGVVAGGGFRITASVVVDPDTGEILSRANRRVRLTREGKLLVEVVDKDGKDKGDVKIDDIWYEEKALSPRVETVPVLVDYRDEDFSICSTLREDSTGTEEDALRDLHLKLSPTSPATKNSALGQIYNNFFNTKKYDLAFVGRHKIIRKLAQEGSLSVLRFEDGSYSWKNEERIQDSELPVWAGESVGKRAGPLWRTLSKPIIDPETTKVVAAEGRRVALTREGNLLIEVETATDTYSSEIDGVRFKERSIPRGLGRISVFNDVKSVRTLSREDIADTMKGLVRLLNDPKSSEDDIDHLGNRRVRAIGELLENQFRIGFARVEKVVRTQMGVMDLMDAKVLPNTLLNTKPLAAAVKGFYASSQLCQFMDQTNPLAEITHKRRLSALGPGGLTRERAGFEVRDVHHSHYGRVCPIETPEGPNIGLISSLATCAKINELGFLETPYRKVENGMVSDDFFYLDAEEEDRACIVEAKTPMSDAGKLTGPMVWARTRGDIIEIPPAAVDYMDISPKQLVSVATALIPFLEHDDANRALMGSNMQRQAVPLVRTEPPVIGTGMERIVARDSGMAVVARRNGVVAAVDSVRIIIYADTIRDKDGRVTEAGGVDIYNLVKFQRSNQSTCLNQKPLVRKAQRVAKGEVIGDGPSMSGGELALGAEVMVAFMPWRGYNFEDAVVCSERLLKDDRFSSIHVEMYEEKACDTKLGPEEITRDVPNVAEEALRNIDEDGLARVGAEVNPGDILVSRVAPKGDTEQTPEEKLLRAIFGEKAEDVRDTSLRVPPGVDGKILRKKIFARKNREERLKSRDLAEIKAIEQEGARRKDAVAKRFESESAERELKLAEGLKGLAEDSAKAIAQKDSHREAQMRMKQLLAEETEGIERDIKDEVDRIKKGDELIQTVLKLAKIFVAKKRRIQVGDKVAGRHGNKGVVSRILPEEDMPYLPDGTPVDMVLNPLGVPSRMNVGQIYETHLGWAARKLGKRVATPVFDGPDDQVVKSWLKDAGLPESGKTLLFDGLTGEAFDNPVAVGSVYMMKLIHLVEGKIHARSTGPYSLVSQQPLGGKAQFGGQRFGEMEVWALEGYGAAYTLQEILTVKSDDVSGRAKTYEALVKGQNVPKPGIPEAFNVMVKELQSLGLNVEIMPESKRLASKKGKEQRDEEGSDVSSEKQEVK